MSSQSLAIGTEIAHTLPITSQIVVADTTPPNNVRELLNIIGSRQEKHVPMLRTTAVRLSEFLHEPIDHLKIEALVDIEPAFRTYLRDRRYSDNSIRTYCQNARRLLRWAEEIGWVSSKQSVEEAWAPLTEALQSIPRSQMKVIRFAVRIGRLPSEFTSDDLDAWAESMIQSGRQYRTARQGKWLFRKAVAQAGVESLLPKLGSASRPTVYRVRPGELPEPLKSETNDLLLWKQAKYARGRPQWTRHRPVSAKMLERTICRLFGFARDIGQFDNIASLSMLFREDVVAGFIEWGLNSRDLSRSTLMRLSMLYGAMRHHPKYSGADYSWFKTLFDEVPETDQAQIQLKKASKFVPHGQLQTIPSRLREARMKLDQTTREAALRVQDELMIVWLTVLPWRQRNIRECRIGSPETANLFTAPLPPMIHIAKPQWVQDAISQDPQHSFWQFHFRKDETKIKTEVRGIIPRILVPLLQEYLHSYRPLLLTGKDPGTLFLNRDGVALDRQTLTYQISEIVLAHTGRRMTPHLFRDAFALAWLEAHPEDFLTLSKILFHKSVTYTLSVYGRNFDESNGARRIDDWFGENS